MIGFPLLERILMDALSGIRRFQSHRPPGNRLLENGWCCTSGHRGRSRSSCGVTSPNKLAPAIQGLGIERVVARVRMAAGEALREADLHVTNPGARGVAVREATPDDEPTWSRSTTTGCGCCKPNGAAASTPSS